MSEGHNRRLAVVGGGIAGLVAAYELARLAKDQSLPLNVDLFESADRLGGVIRTEREGSFLLDAGPDSLIRFKPSALVLCRELGLESEIIPTLEVQRGIYLYSRGRLRALPYGAHFSSLKKAWRFMRSGVLTPHGLVRAGADLVLPPREAPVDESIANFFGRRFGSEAVERVIDPLLAGIYAGDAHRLSIHSTFPRFPEAQERHRSLLLGMIRNSHKAGAGFCSLRGGMGRLVEKLCASLTGTDVHLSTGVTSVAGEAASYRLLTTAGPQADYAGVVLAVPAPIAARLLWDWAPELAKQLGSIRFVSSATVFLAYRRRDMDYDPRGHGFLVPRGEGRRINGATWISNKYARRAPVETFLARCYVGGDRTGDLMSREDSELVAVCCDELREIAGMAAEPIFSRVFRFEGAGPQYDVGHAQRLKRIERQLTGQPGLFLTGSSYRGVGIADCVRDGRATAQAAIAFLFER